MFYKIFIIFIGYAYILALNADLISFLGYKYNYNFIVKFLCIKKDDPENLCKGSCYLESSFEKNDEQNKTSQKPEREQNNFSISLHNKSKGIDLNNSFFRKNRYFTHNLPNLISFNKKPLLPPPKIPPFLFID